jgi:hypothetical protein
MREKEIKVDREMPNDDYYAPNINPDSITTIQIPMIEGGNGEGL